MLEEFHLEQHIDQLVDTYSLGMKNKLFFAINLARDPEILLLDEPFTSFDLESQKKSIDLLKQRASENRITLFSSHMEDLFVHLANRMYILDKGCLYSESIAI